MTKQNDFSIDVSTSPTDDGGIQIVIYPGPIEDVGLVDSVGVQYLTTDQARHLAAELIAAADWEEKVTR